MTVDYTQLDNELLHHRFLSGDRFYGGLFFSWQKILPKIDWYELKEMISGGRMGTEKIRANESQLNQKAKDILQETGRAPDPNGLYCLQLVRWAVQSEGREKVNEHLLLFLELLEGWRPESVMTFLEKNPRGEFLATLNGRNGSLRDLALQILEHFDRCMVEKVEGYHRKKRPAPPLTANQKIAA